MEKDGSFANYTYDHDGKIILLRKAVPTKAFNPNVTVHLVDEREKAVRNTLPFRKEKKKDTHTNPTIVNSVDNSGFIPDESLDIPILVF